MDAIIDSSIKIATKTTVLLRQLQNIINKVGKNQMEIYQKRCVSSLVKAKLGLAVFFTIPFIAHANTPIFLDQGSQWNNQTRQAFYSQDQGSRMVPLKWMQALKQTNGHAFMADDLSRYGYLPNPKTDLPIGFTVSTEKNGEKILGMTCSACHTRQIEVNGKAYRIDGGPAISDFQGFLAGMDKAFNTVLTNKNAFAAFAKAVLGASASQTQKNQLQKQVKDWFLRYDTLVQRSLPTQSPWGLARLDAIWFGHRPTA
jgi:hypothetical protein